VLISNARIKFGVSCRFGLSFFLSGRLSEILVLRRKITPNSNFSSCFRLSWYYSKRKCRSKRQSYFSTKHELTHWLVMFKFKQSSK